VELVTDPEVALIALVPMRALCANPALLIVAVAVVPDVHVVVLVRSSVLPSVKVPVEANCWLVPKAIDGVAGVIVNETSAAEVTVAVVEPVTDPEVAVTLAVPSAILLATPGVGAPVLIVRMAGVSVLQSTVVVMSCVLPSVYVPVAVNAWVVPKGSVGIAGVTAIDTNTAGLIVKLVDPVIPFEVALTPVLPTARLVAMPCPFTVAIPESVVVHVTPVVSTSVPPSL